MYFVLNKGNNICNIVRVFVFQPDVWRKHYRMRDLKLAARRSASGCRQKKNYKKNKPRVDYEPRSAHGRAVNKPTALGPWPRG